MKWKKRQSLNRKCVRCGSVWRCVANSEFICRDCEEDMSMATALMDLAGKMERDAKEHFQDDKFATFLIQSYVDNLRTLLKATEEKQTTLLISPDVAKKTLEEMPEKRRQAATQEKMGSRTVELVGIDSASDVPTLIEIPADMPEGANTRINGLVYQLWPDGKLHPVQL